MAPWKEANQWKLRRGAAMKFQVIGSAVLSALLALGVGCSGDQEASEPTEADGQEEASGGEGETDAASTGEEAATTPAAEPTVEQPPVAEPPPTEPTATAFQGPKVVRYITAYALNVRAEPSKSAKVIRHIKHGDKVEVVLNGEWAQLGPGEFIATTRLSETPPPPKKWMTSGAGPKADGKKQISKKGQ